MDLIFIQEKSECLKTQLRKKCEHVKPHFYVVINEGMFIVKHKCLTSKTTLFVHFMNCVFDNASIFVSECID